MKFRPHKYQQASIDFALDRIEDGGGAGLFLDPGLGKTAITLAVIDWLRLLGCVKRTLIVAPLRVCYQVWPKEIRKWGYNWGTSLIHGTQRDRSIAMRSKAPIHITNIDGVKFMTRKGQKIAPYDLVVFDESTAFKTWMSQRSRAARKLADCIPRRLILTGTPAANSYFDLLGQMYLVDRGEALGKTKGFFEAHFCKTEFGGYMPKMEVDEERKSSIDAAIAPKVLRLDAESNLDMPERITNDVFVQLQREPYEQYKTLELEMFLELENDTLTVGSGGAKYAKCRTLANGGIYNVDEVSGKRETHHIHDAKVEAVKEIVGELQGKPALVAYPFEQDLERLRKAFPKAPVISGGQSPSALVRIIKAFQTGRYPVLLCQPLAMSHGIDGLQEVSSDIIWLGVTDRPEVYKQMNARIYRQGAKRKTVRIHRVLAWDTIDEAIVERLDNKAANEQSLFQALMEYRKCKRPARTRKSLAI